jgi:4-hydroxybenzoate polyprenyltransferase
VTDIPRHRDRPGEGYPEKRMDGPEILGRSILILVDVAGILGLFLAVGRLGGWHLLWISAGAVLLVVGSQLASDRLDLDARRRQGLPSGPIPIPRGHLRWMAVMAVVQCFLGFWLVTGERERHEGGDTQLVLGVALLAAAVCTTIQAAGRRRYLLREPEGPAG